ncbi:MAG: ATP-binding protein, partial [Acidobacteriota bacterium]
MVDYEKLGLFYLGREYDLANQQLLDALTLYDSRDLVTHAVCVGMTGSGKTGLCLGLLEEAAMDGIPAIAVDPKGDLGNLLLTFPNLAPADFRPWIDEDEARRQGLDPDAFAAKQAEAWRKGLAEWGQDGGRIARLRQSADFAIYTPGSTAGIPLSLLRSFAAPPDAIKQDTELLAERAATSATGVLSLVGVDVDPLTSREHILLSNLFVNAWNAGANLSLPDLVERIQRPPMAKVGVVDLESFYPQKERFELAMRLNNLLASPATAAWMAGEPLDAASLLHSPSGKPRISIVSIAHLSDPQRQFVVALLLNEIVGWMRRQSGTESLRAVFYMDEIAGYFPPVANPPAKGPLLTLLKQGRAFGIGAVLATQNPVDLDYKGLANTGTWFIGRLQTDRDRQRVIEALEGVAGAPDRPTLEKTITGLGKRVFLMHNVHDDAPTIFQTRWTMSYLRGPLTREQIRVLTPVPAASPARPAAPVAAAQEPAARSARAETGGTSAPVLPGDVPQYFLRASGDARYRPFLYAKAKVEFSSKDAFETRDRAYLVPMTDGPVPVSWDEAEASDLAPSDLETTPTSGATFAPVPRAASQAKNYAAWQKDFARWITQSATTDVLRSARFKLTSAPGENERDFRARLQHALREQRDAAVQALRQKYAGRVAAQTTRVERAEAAAARESQQASQQRLQTMVSFGATLLGAVLGKKAVSATTLGRATTAARGVGRSMKEAQDVARATGTVQEEKDRLAQLETELAAEVAA